MKFFSGFCFEGEEELFDDYLQRDDFCVAGFSYGAIKALKYTSTCRARVDKLQLFSPAFFQDRDEKFKRLQTLFFAKNQDRYIEDFLEKTLKPSKIDISRYRKKGTNEELEELLSYKWKKEEMEALQNRGIEIEVYLGGDDNIINPNSALEFFKPISTVYYIKNSGHLLKSRV